MVDLRCNSKKHAELDGLVLQVKCSSRFCGAGPGVVVLHHFDALTGQLIKTASFKDAAAHGRSTTDVHISPVRSS